MDDHRRSDSPSADMLREARADLERSRSRPRSRLAELREAREAARARQPVETDPAAEPEARPVPRSESGRAAESPAPTPRPRPRTPPSYTWTATGTREPPPSGARTAAVVGTGVALLAGAGLLIGILVAQRSTSGSSATTTAEPATTLSLQARVERIGAALQDATVYVESGAEADAEEIGIALSPAAAAGVDLRVVVLATEPPEGPLRIAAAVVDDIGSGTVLVIADTRTGISSSDFDGTLLDRALDAGLQSSGGVVGYTAAVADTLVADAAGE